MGRYRINPQRRIDNITCGAGLKSDNFQGNKGALAERHWHSGEFSLGMEYGYILAMQDLLSGKDSTAPAKLSGKRSKTITANNLRTYG